ncbi:MAG: hypothetical protein ACUVR3_03730 [Candidatus Roseilinea sp.]|uniref:hypothetical protein n=1 Tax=Candidatus Roseilinea sp. TaxID=2838777 RepID=UPI00404920B6
MNASEHYRRLLSLIPEPPSDVGTVTAVLPDGCTVALLNGSTTKVRGEAAVGEMVYIRDGVIEGPAPNLPMVEIEV